MNELIEEEKWMYIYVFFAFYTYIIYTW